MPAAPGTQSPGNMFVPVDLLKPILEDLIAQGPAQRPGAPVARASTPTNCAGACSSARVSPDGPAERAGLKSGDIVLAVGGEEVTTLADFYREVWGRGAAGAEVPLKVLQGSRVRDGAPIDRVEYFRTAKTY